jgi:hypothetical protein
MSFEWVKDKPNILSPANLSKIEEAFQRGIIFGYHCFYCGGGSPDNCAFLAYDDLISYLRSRARPGDLFILWSLPSLVETGVQLFSRSFPLSADEPSPMVSEEELEPVKNYLLVLDPKHAPYYTNEVHAIYYSSREKTTETRVVNFYSKDNWESDWREVLDDIGRYSHPGGEIHFFPEPAIDSDDKILLTAKYPNERGEVPIGGAY